MFIDQHWFHQKVCWIQPPNVWLLIQTITWIVTKIVVHHYLSHYVVETIRVGTIPSTDDVPRDITSQYDSLHSDYSLHTSDLIKLLPPHYNKVISTTEDHQLKCIYKYIYPTSYYHQILLSVLHIRKNVWWLMNCSC